MNEGLRRRFEERRAEEVAEGRVHLPAGACDGMSDKQVEFYLSLRGRFRFALAHRFEEHCKRVKAAYGDKQPATCEAMLRQSVEAARKLMAAWDQLPAERVFALRVDGIGALILTGMSECKEALEALR